MRNDAPNPILAHVWRGERVESIHRGTFAVVDQATTLSSAGAIDEPQFLRSSAKPFQAIAAIDRILAAGFALSDREIAVIGASHGGQPLHVDAVREMLRRAGLSEADLQCGSHSPFHGPTAEELARAGTKPGPLHHNCSGKHAGMLLAARLSGEPTENYLDPSHPVQVRNRCMLATFAAIEPSGVGVEIDGCSAPTFVLSTRQAARAFAHLVSPGSVDAPRLAWSRFLAAVPREPVAYCGDGRICTRFLTATAGRILPKVGAEGFYALGIPGSGIGIATKFDDGSHRATEALIATLLLRSLDAIDDAMRKSLEAFQDVPIKNARGRPVGRITVTLP